MRKRKPITYLATVPASTTVPTVLYSFKVSEEYILEDITVNAFDDVDGTAGLQILIGSSYTIPDNEAGDGFLSGDNTTYTIPVGDDISLGKTIRIVGKNIGSADAHFFLVFNFKYKEEGAVEDAPSE